MRAVHREGQYKWLVGHALGIGWEHINALLVGQGLLRQHRRDLHLLPFVLSCSLLLGLAMLLRADCLQVSPLLCRREQLPLP